MYNDGVITTEFTGYYDSVADEYIYPSAPQNFVIVFPTFYLSAADGDITTNGVTFSSEVCQGEDITIGNAPAKVLSTTFLNPDGLMENLDWDTYGTAYLGVATATTEIDLTATPAKAYAKKGTTVYRMTANTAYAGIATASISGQPMSIFVADDGKAWFYTDTNAYYYDGNTIATATPTDFNAAKGRYKDGIGILLDANGVPVTRWTITDDSGKAAAEETSTYIPMGSFDFSNVDAYGITFGAEAYDKMVLFDADATDWVSSLDFTTPLTISDLITALMTEMGMTASVSASAVNTDLSFSENPITAYSCTYRQILKWLAESIGCNVRIGRTGTVEFWVFNGSSPVETIRPDVIIFPTRTKARYTVPQITEVVCYDTLGYNYASGSSGVPYYIAANPFLQNLDSDTTPLANLLTLIRSGVPTYYPTTITVGCADPRIDSGDFVTVNTTDNTLPYVIPIMRQTLNWTAQGKAIYTASGNQQRAVPSDLVESNLATTVNGRKILEGVDAKRITVLDEDENVLFNADVDTEEVYIAGFTVADESMDYTKTEPSGDGVLADKTNTAVIHVGTDAIYRDVDAWEEFYDELEEDYVAGEVKYSETLGGGGTANNGIHAHYEVVNSGGLGYNTYTADSHLKAEELRFDYTMEGDVPGETFSRTDYTGLHVDNGLVQANYRANEIRLISSTHTKVITANGPTVTRDQDTTSLATGTWTNLASFTLGVGVWLITAIGRFTANATGRRSIVLTTTSAGSTSFAREFADTSAAVTGGQTMAQFAVPYNNTTSRTVYLTAFQNSGGSLDVDWAYDVVRLA